MKTTGVAIRWMVGVAFAAFAILKLKSGLDPNAFVPPILQGIAVIVEITLAVALLATRSRLAARFALAFSLAALAVAGAYHQEGATRSCGCLGTALDLSRVQHLTMVGLLLLLCGALNLFLSRAGVDDAGVVSTVHEKVRSRLGG